MATANIHSKYIIKCPRNVDPDQVNTENFKEFIPPNIRATQVKGLTLKSFLVIGKLLINFLKVMKRITKIIKKDMNLESKSKNIKPAIPSF
jgi:hypothetical protein